MKIGYARVSTEEQELGGQILALKNAGCEVIYSDKISGTLSKRPELNRMIEALKPGDIVHVQKLDRLGRSLQHLISLVNLFKDKDVGFISLGDNFDTTTSNGRLLFNIIGSIAEFERDLISERTKNGLAYVKKTKNKVLGRKAVSKDDTKKILSLKHKSISDIARECNVSRPTVYKVLRGQ